MGSIYQIEKLDEGNYDSWSIQMRSVLVHAEAWKVMDGQRPEAEAVNWNALDEKALAMITLSVKPSQLCYLKNCMTAASAWKKLKDVHQPSGPVRKVSLYKQLLGLQMIDGDAMCSYINKFCSAIDKLSELDIKLSEELAVIILLSSLPKQYENFVIAMETRDSLPSLEVLKIKLLEEGERRGTELKPVNCSEQQAFHANTKSLRKKKGEKKDVECYRCGQRGHYRNQCKNKIKEESTKTQQQQHRSFTVLAAADVCDLEGSSWCLDSGATAHMSCVRSLFTNYVFQEENVVLADNNVIRAVGRGDVILRTEFCELKLENVLHVPQMKGNFVSVSRAVERGYTVSFNNKCAVVSQQGQQILKAVKRNKLFVFESNSDVCFSAAQCSAELWHFRYGHLNYGSLMNLTKNKMVVGIENVDFSDKSQCRTCMKCKIHTQPFSAASENRAKQLLELVHTDVCGPFEKRSLGGSAYFLTFIDDMSRRIFTFFLKSKDEVFEKFVEFKNMVERQTGRKIKVLRSDNGREYVNKRFDDFLKQHGITRQLTVPYSPQQNGVAERANRTLVEMARSLLVHSNMPEFLWAESVQTAVYIRNRSPTTSLAGVTPFEAWSGRKPNVQNMRIFGSVAVGLDKTRHSKFQAKGKEYRLVGYSLVSKAYRLFDKEKHQIVEKRDVLFDEPLHAAQNDEKVVFNFPAENSTADASGDDIVKLLPCSDDDDQQADSFSDNIESDEYASAEEPEPVHRQGKVGPGRPKLVRTGMPGRPKKDYNIIHAMQTEEIPLPHTFDEARSSKHVSYWQAAMDAEYEALVANDTWTLTDLPKGQQAIGCKWVYTVKRDEVGAVKRYKARLVAKGCSQKFGVNYCETFSPVCRYETIRLILALSVELKLYLHQMDVCTAYLNSELKDVVYMRQPEGYADKTCAGKVLRLNKAIYGLKQAGREWNSKLKAALIEIGFTQCQNEPCLYKQDIKGSLCLILIYVDDLLIACQKKTDLMQIKSMISTKFECVDKGQLEMFLGMQIQRDGDVGDISMNQSLYIKDMLQRHSMQQCRVAATPLDTGYQVACDSERCVEENPTAYQSAIGELMWLALTSRPDIYHSVVKLAQRNKNPHSEHVAGVKHVMRYLAATIDLKLNYCACGQALEGFVDADWGGDMSNRRSYTGYVFFLAGGPISWKSEKQGSVALSSTEAEYMALSSAAKEALHLRRLMIEIGCGKANTPIVLYGDNLSAQSLAKNPVYHARSKHIDIRKHFVREVVQNGDIELKYISTEKMIADVLTKNLSKTKHSNFVKLLNLY